MPESVDQRFAQGRCLLSGTPPTAKSLPDIGRDNGKRPTMHAVDDQSSISSLPLRWRNRWAERPDQIVLYAEEQWLNGAESDKRTHEIAMRLASNGVRPGDRVVWEAESSVEGVIGALSVLRLGAVLVPVNVRQSDLERATVLDEVGASFLLGAPRTNHDETIPWTFKSSLDQEKESLPSLDEARLDDLALIIFTSGTTGKPKGAMITHGNLAAQADALAEAWGWTLDDRLLSALPLFHVHGLVVSLFTSLAQGGSIVVKERFEANDFLAAIKKMEITMCFCVPTMLHRMIDTPDVGVLAQIRLVVSGSAPLAQSLHERYQARGISILERYGMTESLLTLSNPLVGERRPGTVGLPLPGVVADLPEKDDGEQELRIKGPGVFAGYWNLPDATAEVFDDGWLKTGDIVRVDSQGYVVVCGRSKELIITGGFNVYPSEVEDLLNVQASIVDSAVVGMPDDEWGEVVIGYVVVREGFKESIVLAALSEVLSSYKIPRRLIVEQSLPRNALGKLQRHLLT